MSAPGKPDAAGAPRGKVAPARLDEGTRIDLIQSLRARLGHGDDVGVVLLRLRRYREFNVLFGFEAAARLSSAAAGRIAAALRPVDTVFQFGAHEFACLLPGLHGENHALLAAQRLSRVFAAPVALPDGPVLASVAIGVSVHPAHGDDADLLLRRAEIAYGKAVRSSGYVSMFEQTDERRDVSYHALFEAITRNRLRIYLQPIVELASGRIVAAEALSRWADPAIGCVDPEHFVPVAEQTGLIGELTRWNLNATLRHVAAGGIAERGLRVSVNLSPHVFLEPGFEEQLGAALRLWGVPPRALVIEVTEGAIMEDPDASARVLERMRALGLGISIDDFGAGHSSYAYLKRFPATEIKIERSFVAGMRAEARTGQLVASMVDLAHRLDMLAIAEGVEDEATRDALVALGCDRAQGFLFSRPLPAEEFIAALPPL